MEPSKTLNYAIEFLQEKNLTFAATAKKDRKMYVRKTVFLAIFYYWSGYSFM